MLQTPEFWVAVAFVAFVILTFKPISKQVKSALDNYAAGIKKDLDEARSLKTEAKKLLSDYQRKHHDALEEGKKIIERAEHEATRVKQKAEKDLFITLKRMELQTIERIENAKQKAMAEVKNMAVDIALSASNQVLQEILSTAPDQEKLIELELDLLPRKLN